MADSNFAYLWFLLILSPIALLIFLYFIVRPRPVKIAIKNRHVFITGGSSGIGLALAHRAASEGARVSILARSLDKLKEAKESISLATGVDVAIFAVDVREYDAVRMAVEEAGPIDVLVVNQGVFIPQELEKQDLDEVKFMVDVGIYGYTAYSASKFGLRGLAEALQQELISQDIHVSLIFPPDTDTPGMAEEVKRRPQLTSVIAAASGAMGANEVAKKALDGIKCGSFIIHCNLEGLLLSIATAGLSPQRSFLMAFVEVFAAGLIRVAALCFQWNWYSSIEKWHVQHKQ
ncbi:hypothetical protein F8388_021556 [Cannabis sativa]|uniref:Uncharacterized protein n=1 Tax=Cannabis sativa TaxID=3483 RepID=A0A7J6FE36_CANSA|nr:hypothetical protein F8388_021556 [Cannabis sativa]KAF4379475.1 hypothetical protein G4B88_024923 [Cannabis sativa]